MPAALSGGTATTASHNTAAIVAMTRNAKSARRPPSALFDESSTTAETMVVRSCMTNLTPYISPAIQYIPVKRMQIPIGVEKK